MKNNIAYPNTKFFNQLINSIEYSEKLIEERLYHETIKLLRNTDKILDKKMGKDIYARYCNIKNELKKVIGI